MPNDKIMIRGLRKVLTGEAMDTPPTYAEVLALPKLGDTKEDGVVFSPAGTTKENWKDSMGEVLDSVTLENEPKTIDVTLALNDLDAFATQTGGVVETTTEGEDTVTIYTGAPGIEGKKRSIFFITDTEIKPGKPIIFGYPAALIEIQEEITFNRAGWWEATATITPMSPRKVYKVTA